MEQDFEEELRTLLDRGQKIEAIKRYRQRFGVGLAEAKDAIDALEQSSHLPEEAQHFDPADIEHEIVSLLEQDRKIEAIKVYREFRGGGLKEAKDAVEKIASERGIPMGKSGCLGAILAVIVLVSGFASRLLG